MRVWIPLHHILKYLGNVGMLLHLYSQERNAQALFTAIQILILYQNLLSIQRVSSRYVDSFDLSSIHACIL